MELAAADSRVLVTRDKKTMPGHLVEFYEKHDHAAGVIMIRSRSASADVVEHMLMYWLITTLEEWTDRVEVIPYESRKRGRRKRRK